VFYVRGAAGKKAYMHESGLGSSEALVDAEIVSEVFEKLARQKHPLEFPANGDLSRPDIVTQLPW